MGSSSPFLLFLIVLTISAQGRAQFVPKATLYSALDGSGSFLNLPTNIVPNLATLGFNNVAKSACILGTWMFYDAENFNGAGNGAMEYIFEPVQRCVNFQSLGGYVSSVRVVGASTDYRQDSITFYADAYFQNDEEFGLGDLPHLRLNGRIASLVITGSSHWTIYEEPNFGGAAICLQVTPTPEYAPTFIPDTIELDPTVPHGSIASVRKGCYSEKKIIRIQQGLTSGNQKVVGEGESS